MPEIYKRLKPVRIQRSRQHKTVNPNGLPIIYVGRPSRFGNPFKDMKDAYDRFKVIADYSVRNYLLGPNPKEWVDRVRKELRGKNLSCWCPLDQACHADILLEIANG